MPILLLLFVFFGKDVKVRLWWYFLNRYSIFFPFRILHLPVYVKDLFTFEYL